MKSRVTKLEARKGLKKKTAIIQLLSDMREEEEVRECVARLTADIAEPFDEWIIHNRDATEPALGWFGDLGELLDEIAAIANELG